MNKIAFTFLLFIAYQPGAYAYLDPGSGSMLLYFVMGVLASIIYYLKGVAFKIVSIVKGGRVDKKLNDLTGVDILFHSEGGQYWNVFLPIIEELEKRGVRSAYYTSSKDDPGLKSNFKKLRTAYIGGGLSAYALLNSIKVKVFVSTTPQLDVMQWRKSKHVHYYIHVIHAPTGVLMYKYYSFDFFDVIMCSGKHQIESIRALEKERGLPAKKILRTGLTYYDVMAKHLKEYPSQKENKRKTLLIAPTWKADNLLERYGSEFLINLANKGYSIIVRPHPQSFISTPMLISNIEKEVSNHSGIKFDTNPSGANSMSEADLLISDLSGVLFDFFFVFLKPVIVIRGTIETAGKEAKSVEKTPWELDKVKEIATVINIEELSNIETHILNALDKARCTNIAEIRNDNVFNFGRSGTIAADQILELVRN